MQMEIQANHHNDQQGGYPHGDTFPQIPVALTWQKSPFLCSDHMNLCISAVFRNLPLPTAHPTLTMAHEGTPQNFTLLKGGKKQYVATKM
jgi:hypothetical protein